MGGPFDNHRWCCRKEKNQKITQHVPGVCLLACETPRTSHGPCKMMRWGDQRDLFEAGGEEVRAFAHTRSTFPHVSNMYASAIRASWRIRSHARHTVTHGEQQRPVPTHLWPRGGSHRGIRAQFSLEPKREAPDPRPSLSKYSQWAQSTRAFIITTVGESELS